MRVLLLAEMQPKAGVGRCVCVSRARLHPVVWHDLLGIAAPGAHARRGQGERVAVRAVCGVWRVGPIVCGVWARPQYGER
jgi:hypothetical protein